MLSAKSYLEERIAQNNHANPSKKLAIVLDVDETSLSNYENLQSIDFGLIPHQINELLKRGNAKPISLLKSFLIMQ